MREMSREEWRAFVGEGTRTGKIAVVRRDGQPLVTPVWFLLDDADPGVDRFVFTTHASGAKARTVREPVTARGYPVAEFATSTRACSSSRRRACRSRRRRR